MQFFQFGRRSCVKFKRGRKYIYTHVYVYTIHQVWPSACGSKQLLYESDHSSGSISELSLSYSSYMFYGSIGAEAVFDKIARVV